MRVLVVGSGGREHTLAWALQRSPEVDAVYVAPGNGGTHAVAQNVAIPAEDVRALTEFATHNAIDLVVVGPEAPLALGLVDVLQRAKVPVFGPTAAAARLESSKAFSKAFMVENNIPTAAYRSFTDYPSASAYLAGQHAPIVIKASGLAAGKGVIICQTMAEAEAALRSVMVERDFGAAGDEVIIEEYLTGQEVSVLAFCDGKTASPMILAQDHKAAYDGDKGPNTGGMGCYAPAAVMDTAQQQAVLEQVLQPVLRGMAAQGTPYVGILYAGLMLTPHGFKVLEFNCRFGDPETQVILPLLETSLAEVMLVCLNGTLDTLTLRWRPGAAVCVVLAAGGYPGHYRKHDLISGLDFAAAQPGVLLFHAGTTREDGAIYTAGGRVLGVTATAPDLHTAIHSAYAAAGMISWPDMHYRRDIGAKGLRGEA
ncbi:MAG: phosphoribosylamine--glycine ligase [Chloroflexi bacterium]|nr:phosphoribosylamine--glycine ligase [Chloroflexota bacterium]